MYLNVAKEVAALQRLIIGALHQRYAEAFGEQTTTKNRPWLVKRPAWRLQSLAGGDLSERTRRRVAELSNDAYLRTSAPRCRSARRPPHRSEFASKRSARRTHR